MKEFNCSTWVVSAEGVQTLKPVKEQNAELKAIVMPPSDHWLAEGSYDVYPYTKTWEESKFDPLLGMYTSGTTGKPEITFPITLAVPY